MGGEPFPIARSPPDQHPVRNGPRATGFAGEKQQFFEDHSRAWRACQEGVRRYSDGSQDDSRRRRSSGLPNIETFYDPGKQPEPWRFGFSEWALTVEGEGSALTCRRGVRERNEPALPVRRAGRPRAWTRR